jgi:hypothetical protein
MVMKRAVNPCRKTRPVDDPYEIWIGPGGWEWYVLKKYKSPETEARDPYARWFCLVKSPIVPDGELGDVYVRDIKRLAVLKETA